MTVKSEGESSQLQLQYLNNGEYENVEKNHFQVSRRKPLRKFSSCDWNDSSECEEYKSEINQQKAYVSGTLGSAAG